MRSFLIVLCFSLQLNGQVKDFQYLGENYWDKELYLGVAVRHFQMEVPNLPNSAAHRSSVWTGDFQLYRSAELEYGAFRYIMRNKLIGEIFTAFGANFNEVVRDEGSNMSHFLLGSHAFAWNSYLHKNFTLALGFNLSDLLVGSTIASTDSFGNPFRFTPAPHGWYLGGGPSLFTDIALHRHLLVEFQFDYIFHFSNPVPLTYGESEPDQALPHQVFLSFNLMTSAGFYLGIDYTLMRDRSPRQNHHHKLEALLGFKIML